MRWTALVLAMAGCTSDFGRRDGRSDDPLLGNARPANQPVAVVSANPSATPTLQPPSYSPQPNLVPTSNAALASGGFQPLSGSSDLRIGDGSASLGAPNGVALQSPAFADVKPAPPPNAAGTAVAPAPPPNFAPAARSNGPAGGGGLEAVVAANPQLRFTTLTYNGESREWTCKISVPNKLNTSVPRVVEGTAATQEQAIREALAQLARD
ncbi:MAG: hypothetical protein U0746_20155 [Gemmataceae bacterium]